MCDLANRTVTLLKRRQLLICVELCCVQRSSSKQMLLSCPPHLVAPINLFNAKETACWPSITFRKGEELIPGQNQESKLKRAFSFDGTR